MVVFFVEVAFGVFIEVMLQSQYSFFIHNAQKYLEFFKLVKTLTTKG
jgi:hypothetical protein